MKYPSMRRLIPLRNQLDDLIELRQDLMDMCEQWDITHDPQCSPTLQKALETQITQLWESFHHKINAL